MGTVVAASVPLVQSIGISRGILNNRRIAGSLEAVMQGVKRGEGIAIPLGKAGEFPPLASHLLSVGEETGRLDAMFNRMADIYDAETRNAIRRFTSLFDPLIILVMGPIIALFAALVAPRMLNQADKAKRTAAHAQINSFMTALGAYKLDTGNY